jgi:ABC-type glycerol-3-phosphate transport system substrate-binding protein
MGRMLRRVLLQVLLFAGIGVNVAFLLINASPERPHLGRKRAFKVLLRVSPDEAAWVRDNEIAEFSATHDLDISVETAPTYEAVLERLKTEAAHPTDLLLADLNDELADDAIRAGALRPIIDGATADRLEAVNRDYLPEGLKRAHVGTEKLWALPARSEIDTVVYFRPAVEDAYLHWEQDRERIDATIKAINGVGLPTGYHLKRMPDHWDSFDLFVASWYWSHHPAPWADGEGGADGGVPQPRVAIRTGPSDEALRDLLTSFYLQGVADADIAAGKVDVPSVIDALQWQALWRREGVAVRGQKGVGVTAEEVYELLKKRELAWAPLSVEQSFLLHGGARAGAPPGIDRPSDLGWSVMPKGVSMELKNGKPARSGHTFSFHEISFWVAPKNTPDIQVAFQLARFMTQPGIQQREAEALGRLPVRVTVRDNYPILFRLPWMQNIFDACFQQLDLGSGDIPDQVADQHLDERYRELRRRVVFRQPPDSSLSFDTIQALVRQPPPPPDLNPAPTTPTPTTPTTPTAPTGSTSPTTPTITQTSGPTSPPSQPEDHRAH